MKCAIGISQNLPQKFDILSNCFDLKPFELTRSWQSAWFLRGIEKQSRKPGELLIKVRAAKRSD
ncbi:hypothetical protein NBRC116601_19880 [Cognatishimia sp. WU-CL00825]